MATVSNEIDSIRRQMAQIRRELHEDVQGVVAGAEAVTDWRRYVRLYPWACVGAAAAVGFLVVPRRHRTPTEKVTTVVVPSSERVQEVARELAGEPTKTEKRAGLLGTLLGLLTPIAMRAAQNYAMHFVEHWIQQQGMAEALFPGAAGAGASTAAPRVPGGPPPGMPGPPRRPGA